MMMSTLNSTYKPPSEVDLWAERFKHILTEKRNPTTLDVTQNGFHRNDFTISFMIKNYNETGPYETCKFVHNRYGDIIILVGCEIKPCTDLPTACFLDNRAHEMCAEARPILPPETGLYVAKVWDDHVQFFKAVRAIGGSLAMHPIVMGDRWLLHRDDDFVTEIIDEIRAQFGFHKLRDPLVRLNSLYEYDYLAKDSKIMPEVRGQIAHSALFVVNTDDKADGSSRG
ncbi:hypothetical protein AbraCBS73388_004667 [Aspergillus brasiliensis]|uniref:Uncharacterized protein n=1 Tax=Aspergillus brasiliensis TaxID=319629 RepID=A0A9W5Z133_9EURO|nr:hypothetical protein AbraCBS73388_004667 [Aspergillus brasiliensis]